MESRPTHKCPRDKELFYFIDVCENIFRVKDTHRPWCIKCKNFKKSQSHSHSDSQSQITK
jgi:hypothetical protein